METRRSFLISAGGAGLTLRPARRVRRRQEELGLGGGRRQRSRWGSSPRAPGQAAGFGEVDPYILGLVKRRPKDGVKGGDGKTYKVKIVPKDSQSSPEHAASVAKDLINGTKVDLMLASSTRRWSTRSRTPARPPACRASRRSAVAGVVLRPRRQGGRQGRVQVHLPLLVRRRGLRGRPTSRPGSRSKTTTSSACCIRTTPTATRCARALRRRWRRRASKSSTPAPTTTARTTSRPRSRRSRRTSARSSTRSRCRPTSRRSGSRPRSRATSRSIAADRQDRPVPVAGRGARRPRPGLSAPRSGRRRSRTSPRFLKKTSQELADGYQATGKQWTQMVGSTAALFDAAHGGDRAAPNPKDKEGLADAISKLQVDTPLGHLDWTRARSRTSCRRRWSIASGSRATSTRST